MGFDDVFNNRKPKSRSADTAASVFVNSIKSFEDSREMLFANSASIVSHKYSNDVWKFRKADTNFSTGVGIFYRVVYQVVENLSQSFFVTENEYFVFSMIVWTMCQIRK